MKQDRRVRYTRKVMKDSLLELLLEKPIEKVSVKEICERADINRSTFYVHYGSAAELYDDAKNDLYEEVRMAKEEIGYADMDTFLREIFEVMRRHAGLLRLLVKGMSHMEIMLRIFDLWRPDFDRAMDAWGVAVDKRDVAYMFIATGTGAVICIWAMEGFLKTSQEMAQEVMGLIRHGLGSFIKEDGNHV